MLDDGLEVVGRVVYWKKHPNYGFVRCARGVIDQPEDVFVHVNDVSDREHLPKGRVCDFALSPSRTARR